MTTRRRWQVLAGFVVLFGVCGLMLMRTNVIPERPAFDGFPREVAGYRGRHIPVQNQALRVLKATDYLSRDYVRKGRRINVYVGYHGRQQQGTLIHSPQHCLPANGWYIAERRFVPLDDSPDAPRVNRLVAAWGNERQLIYYWYQGRGRIVADEFRALLWRSRDIALRNRSDEALVRISTPDTGPEAEAALRAFIAEFVRLLPSYVPA